MMMLVALLKMDVQLFLFPSAARLPPLKQKNMSFLQDCGIDLAGKREDIPEKHSFFEVLLIEACKLFFKLFKK